MPPFREMGTAKESDVLYQLYRYVLHIAALQVSTVPCREAMCSLRYWETCIFLQLLLRVFMGMITREQHLCTERCYSHSFRRTSGQACVINHGQEPWELALAWDRATRASRRLRSMPPSPTSTPLRQRPWSTPLGTALQRLQGLSQL